MAGLDVVQVTYREISERFGIGIEGARLKAKRRAAKGEWRIIPGNHPQDVVRVEMPADEFRSGPDKPPRTPPHAIDEGVPTIPPQHDSQRRNTNDLEVLVEIVSQLTAQAQALTGRLIEAEKGRADAERDTAIVRVELKAIESQLAAAQERHLAELKALHERMESEAERVRSELALWKARPWWRRLAS